MKLERIVVGMDFSEASVAAAQWLARHIAPDAELMLLHAIEVPRPPSFLSGRFQPSDEVAASAREGAENRLRGVADALGADRVRRIVVEGSPADELGRAAREMDADLLVVGEHGHRRGLWGALGSTAERLVRCSPVPVLLARGLPDGPPRRILAPIDESDVAADALRWAHFLTERLDAHTVAMHVLNPGHYGVVGAVSTEQKAREFRERYYEQAEQWLRDRLTSAGFTDGEAEAHVAYGEPRYEILAAQQRFGADFIVMGTHGMNVVGRALLGSAASAVLRGAPCPVLVTTAGGCD